MDTNKPEVVVILGSTKFKDHIMGVAQKETLKGNIVLVHGFFHHVDMVPISDNQKRMLDELMLHKVNMAKRCVVVNINGYIGQSTARAVTHAKNIGKPIQYMEKVDG